jgi:hypothetical protein
VRAGGLTGGARGRGAGAEKEAARKEVPGRLAWGAS